MGHRKASDTTDTSSQYYRLIPRGKGFQGAASNAGTEPDAIECTEQAAQWRHELLKAYGYKTNRANEIAQIFSIKALFINNLPENANNAKKALKLLVCDQSTLFEDDDIFYRSNRINASFLSAQKKRNREYRKYQEQCADRALYYYSHSKTPPLYAKVLLNEIIKEAANKHISVRNWLYSKGHMITSSGSEDAANGKRDSVEKSDCRSSLWDTSKLNIESCQKDFHRLYLEYGKDFSLDREGCERFIDLALLFYIQEQEKLAIRFPESSSYRDESTDLFTVPPFKRRLGYIENLEKEYGTRLAPTEDLYKREDWGFEQKKSDFEKERLIPKMCNAICNFFWSLDLSARYCDNLSNRVRSVFARGINDKIPEKMIPIFLLNMVMACRHNIFSDPINDLIQPNDILSNIPLQIPRIDQAKQRYAQLILLDSLCEILNLSTEDKIGNLREYICLYGRNILSFDEVTLWRGFLKGNYGLLPQVGFPLCFLNYCEQCIRPHYEHLNYRRLSELHQGGYHLFYRKNRRRLTSLSQQLSQLHKGAINEYKKAWSNPCLRGTELDELLVNLSKEFPIDLSSFQKVSRCNQEELKLLILETILQMQIRQDAIYILLKGFSSLYQFPLAVAYNKRIKLKPK